MGNISEQYYINHFSEALKNGLIMSYFQPIFRSVTKKIVGAEALTRWKNPDDGFFSPVDFIPALESSGRIYELDMEIIRQTCEFYQRLVQRGTPIQFFSVNLSRHDFLNDDLFDRVCGILEEYNVPKEAIKLEITETLMMEDLETFKKIFYKFKNAGFSVWIDDFGSGYSSLNMIQNFNFDVMKFDMLFLKDFTLKSKQVLSSLITMAKTLGIHTLTEGVETQEQLEFLLSIGCENLQGFYFAKPLSGDELIERIERQNVFLESDEENTYWDQIGQLSFLSAKPLEEYSEKEGLEDSVDDGGLGVPLALLECSKEDFKYTYASQSFRRRIQDLGYQSIDELESIYNDRCTDQYLMMKKIFTDAVGMGTMQKAEYKKDDVYYRISAKCLARRDSHAMLAVRLSTFDSKHEEKSALEMMNYCRALFATYELVVLIYPESEMSNRLYTSENLPEYDRELTLNESVRKFCIAQVSSEDQERYLKFLNFDTVQKRIDESPLGYIQDYFRMRWGGGDNNWYTARLSEVTDFTEKTYILTIQALSGKEIEYLDIYKEKKGL